MFKLITLVVGLAIGFGGGVWFGQKNPDMAAKFSKEEQRQVIEKALALNAQIKAKLEQMQGMSSTPGSGFVSSGSAGGADVKEVKAEADKQEAELQAQLTKLK